MLGAIAGDIIGSIYEGLPIKSKNFPLFEDRSAFTDDTVLSVAVAHSILSGQDYAESLKNFGRRYPRAGYGGTFRRWLLASDSAPYNSWGNGAAMRVSPVGFAFESVEDVLIEAARSAAVSHDHPEGIKGAQATALAVFLARKSASKEEIQTEISDRFAYNLDRKLDDIRGGYVFDVSCEGSVPESILAFLESEDFEDAVRNAVSLGGDADTMACIAGAVAHAYYGPVPDEIESQVRRRLTPDLLQVLNQFDARFLRGAERSRVQSEPK